MQPLRLLFVVTFMVGLLALVAGLASTSEQNRLREREQRTATTAAPPPNLSDETVTASVPRKKTIEVKVGDTVSLSVKLEATDTVTLDAFGVDEDIAGGIATPILFTAISPGRYDLKLRGSGRVIGRVVVTAPEPSPEDDDPEPQTAPRTDEPAIA